MTEEDLITNVATSIVERIIWIQTGFTRPKSCQCQIQMVVERLGKYMSKQVNFFLR